jgi:methyl-accepting chemotaxis protein
MHQNRLLQSTDCFPKESQNWRQTSAMPQASSPDLTERLDRIESICERTVANIEALTQQVGALSEGMTEIKSLIQDVAESSKRQERNIDRLVGIVETLIQRPT